MLFVGHGCLDAHVVEWLARSHDTVHLRDRQLQRLPNGDIFQLAAQEKHVVLTFDLDFGEILAGCGGQLVSVILFRLVNTRPDNVILRLDSVLRQSEPDLVRRERSSLSRMLDIVFEGYRSGANSSQGSRGFGGDM